MASTTRTTDGVAPAQGGVSGFLAAYGEWISLVMRLALAAMWLLYSVPKLGQPAQNAQAVRNFQVLPESLVQPWAYAQPWLEMAFGLLLVLGLGVRLLALFSALLLLVYIVGIISLGARGIRITCGCGGGGQVLGTNQPTRYTLDVLRDLTFMLPALWLLWKPTSKFSLERALIGDPL